MGKSADVATADSGDGPPPPPITDAQYEIFWGWVVANLELVRNTAKTIVGWQDADDVVHSAAILYLVSFARPETPSPFPADETDFLKCLLTIVRNRARNCVIRFRVPKDYTRPVHSHWGEELQIKAGGRKVSDRPLDTVFARTDRDARDVPTGRPPDADEQLREILRPMMAALPPTRFRILHRVFYRKQKREKIAAHLGITKHAYDYHLQAAYRTLRERLIDEASLYAGWREMYWWETIAMLGRRYLGAHSPRRSTGKNKTSTR